VALSTRGGPGLPESRDNLAQFQRPDQARTLLSRDPTGDAVGQVLLVEDDPIVRQAYTKVLRTSGLELETACDGLEALEMVRAGAYDAVVSDINMPRLSGIEFLRALREEALDVPVVLVTGGPALETAVRAVEYGAYRYLTKPVDIEALRDTVRGAAEVGEAARKRRASGGGHAPAVSLRPSAEERAEAQQLQETLAQLWLGYQPIIEGRPAPPHLYGYEALVRSDGPLNRPAEILAAAEKQGRLFELGREIRRRVAAAAATAPRGVLLFVNLHARDLEDPDLFDDAAPLSAVADRVVLELTERSTLGEVPELERRVARLREMGFRLAVDDLGAGYAGLSSFASIEPDVVKLDMSLVRGVDVSPLKQSVVRSVLRLADELGIPVISEGIELPAERDALAALGCALFQGFLYGKAERGFQKPRL
jgi:EAL domain-containing protein (putative c-di-GMP-specific phosphodiesterase class I)/FixJ family two-component response regulator